MKVEFKLFAIGLGFFVVSTIVYAWLSVVLSDEKGPEPVGTTALAFTGGLALLVAFYLYLTGRRSGPRPEDRLDAEIDEGVGEIGFFSPYSIWPVYLGASAATVSVGLVFAHWLIFIGVIATGLSVIGLVFEYYRGEHAH